MATDWTDADRTLLRTAIARGVLTVTLAGESVTYQSLDQMRALLADMDRQLDTSGRSYRLATHNKGLD